MKLKKEFSDFYEQIKIGEEQDSLIEKRETLENDIKENLPTKLSNHGIIVNKSDIRMFDQGSYKYHTTIVSDVIDRDVAVMIPLDIDINPDPRKIKQYLKDAINISSRTVDVKEPCVRASYFEKEKEWMHIDLPLYANYNENIYLARGKENSDTYSWEETDPDGLNEDLCNKINGHEQLRRIICYIKRWRNEKYANSTRDHEIPPSIGLTYLACDCFSEQIGDEGEDDLMALQKTMEEMLNCFTYSQNENGEITSANVHRYLTVKPYSDVFEKMRNSSASYMVTFYKRLKKAVEYLSDAVNVESEHDAGEYVQKVLGLEFVVPEKQATENNTQSKREHSFG